ncbi:hypothetical protein POX_f07942 [Penicillium oxalicum]|uniref:Calcineurin-like phosphoesterase domain-containing protein n=1 Tax=Penicillium oxalicum (strain 114-2 / CGMCC 5302) TaxID=933388 RepID=S7ZJN9_PENO1|nr:hypothetical protein POX_f07942 [Penicillium oxalicum]EPS28866.1 hypothetical protein PDE_03812 [Penicillium oxalicum 114-2]KAI2787571.1 hypothetical protein POX_f07942 [Penicillium oxalicum]
MATGKPRKPIYPIRLLLSDIEVTCPLRQPTPLEKDAISRRRLIIVGDVHGMKKSLQKLLEKVEFDRSQGDHLIFVGDITNKGPDSSGVVDLAMKLEASAVRGNHDNAVLDAAAELAAAATAGHGPTSTSSNPPVMIDAPSEHHEKAETTAEENPMRHGETTYHTVSQLSTPQLEWLATLPLMLRLHLPQDRPSSLNHNVVVVHAGLVPGVALEDQDPYAILHMRSLRRNEEAGEGFVPDEEFGESGWVDEWDRWQESHPPQTTVVFGHDAKRRLQLGKYAIGLDSACLYGHQLSALIITISEGRIEHEIIQVDCADTPVAPKATTEGNGQAIVDHQ